jgi:3-hydroxybutyryl-CoA dehydratase
MAAALAPVAECWTIADLQAGASARVEFTVTAEDMIAFAALSGDHNPLHTDDAFARAKGFDGAVVYGALMVAKVSQLIGMRLPGRDSVWASLAMDFRKPLFVGQPAEVEGTVAEVSASTGMVVLKIAVRAGGKVLAKGQAEVVLVSR